MRENSPSIFRVIGSDIRSIEMHSTPKKIKKSREVEQVAELTKSIVKKNKFIYIDMQDSTSPKLCRDWRQSYGTGKEIVRLRFGRRYRKSGRSLHNKFEESLKRQSAYVSLPGQYQVA